MFEFACILGGKTPIHLCFLFVALFYPRVNFLFQSLLIRYPSIQTLQPPKPAVGKALTYTFKQWRKLVCYVEQGQPGIDNNRAERAIKPLVIGRKNWLFPNTGSGAQASATLYSIIETAKANGLTPLSSGCLKSCRNSLVGLST